MDHCGKKEEDGGHTSGRRRRRNATKEAVGMRATATAMWGLLKFLTLIRKEELDWEYGGWKTKPFPTYKVWPRVD